MPQRCAAQQPSMRLVQPVAAANARWLCSSLTGLQWPVNLCALKAAAAQNPLVQLSLRSCQCLHTSAQLYQVHSSCCLAAEGSSSQSTGSRCRAASGVRPAPPACPRWHT